MKALHLSAALVIILTFLSLPAIAQKEPMKWGNIPDPDLKMTVFDKDTAAEAVVLGNFGELSIVFEQSDIKYEFFNHRRIKFLKRQGFDRGDVAISVYKDEEVTKFDVQVVTPDGEKHKLKNADIFEEEVNDNWRQMKFSAPNLTEGAVLEYR